MVQKNFADVELWLKLHIQLTRVLNLIVWSQFDKDDIGEAIAFIPTGFNHYSSGIDADAAGYVRPHYSISDKRPCGHESDYSNNDPFSSSHCLNCP